MCDPTPNVDALTVKGFGEEWTAFDQSGLKGRLSNLDSISEFPFDTLPADAKIDIGCGSGRWAIGVAPKVFKLHCIDPSPEAIAVARRRLKNLRNVEFHLGGVDSIPLPDRSQDFAYALGVLHHIPDTAAGLRKCAAKLKPGAPILVYLYYRFDNRPGWYASIWRFTNPCGE